jgi:hypothetical protein
MSQEIAVVGSPEFTTGFRLAGVRRFEEIADERKDDELDGAVRTFRDRYRFPEPVRESVASLGVVASFPGRSVALATPDETDWLTERLECFRACPCACLLATDDLDGASEEYPLRNGVSWPDGRVAFFDSDVLGHRLGVVERG